MTWNCNDGDGKEYCDRWARFAADYNVQQRFYLMFTHQCGTSKFSIHIFDGTH
jgi:hypothetical protein